VVHNFVPPTSCRRRHLYRRRRENHRHGCRHSFRRRGCTPRRHPCWSHPCCCLLERNCRCDRLRHCRRHPRVNLHQKERCDCPLCWHHHRRLAECSLHPRVVCLFRHRQAEWLPLHQKAEWQLQRHLRRDEFRCRLRLDEYPLRLRLCLPQGDSSFRHRPHQVDYRPRQRAVGELCHHIYWLCPYLRKEHYRGVADCVATDLPPS